MTKYGLRALLTLLLLSAAACATTSQEAPTVPATTTNPWKTEHFSAAVGDTSQGIELTLELGTAQTTIRALNETEDTGNALDAQVEYVGEMEFAVVNDPPRTITLRETLGDTVYPPDETLHWEIALNPNTLFKFDLKGGAGFLKADLTGIQLVQSILATGAGGGEITLPNMGDVYQLAFGAGAGAVTINAPAGSEPQIPFFTMSNGTVTLNLAAGTDFRARVNMAEGDLIINLPENANFYMDVQVPGTGEIQIPDTYEQIRGRSTKSGTWQSKNYNVREPQIALVIGVMKAGNVIIR